jgi:mannose-6-phosphate isomerase-like protein (cupin superfamily)
MSIFTSQDSSNNYGRYEDIFQFHNTTTQNLEILINTMSAWPGPDEAVLVENYWPFN